MNAVPRLPSPKPYGRPTLDEWLRAQESRCSGCGGHVATQGCSCAAIAARVDALAAVGNTTTEDVKARIDGVIMRHARTGRPFSANTIRPELDGVKGAQIGPRFAALADKGVLVQVGRVQSTDPGTRHQIGLWLITEAHKTTGLAATG